MVTVEEMGKKILAILEDRPAATFIELTQLVGAEAVGEQVIGVPGYEHAILWVGVSNEFIAALNLIRPQIIMEPTNFMVYAMDGAALNMPILPNNAKSMDFEEDTWMPVTISLKTPEKAAKLAKAIEVARKREAKAKKREARAA
jgi:hypothetical protein